MLEEPSQNPDVNPIENLWFKLKKAESINCGNEWSKIGKEKIIEKD